MGVVSRTASVAVFIALGCLIQAGAAQDPGAARRAYLQAVVGLSSADIRHIEAGRPVAASLDGRDGLEVVTFGAVRLRATPAAVLDNIASLHTLRRSAGVLAVGTIAAPPQPSDFQELMLDPADLASLSKCRPGACDVQLPEWAIQRFRDAVAWRSPDARQTADQLARDMAHRIVSGYMTGGHRGLDPYRDRNPSAQPGDEYANILAADQYLPAPFSALRGYLRGYPKATLAGVENRYFWATVEAALKPTTHISHMVVARAGALGPSPLPITGAIVTTQLFATHYYSSTLEWHVVIDDPVRDDECYLIYLSRSWVPGMTGIRGRLTRPIVRGRVRDAIERYLAFAKSVIEAD
jgi:hypothetical protein